jgi:hypothetical protein
MISDKNNAKRFKQFKNSGMKYYQFVNRVKFIFNITNEFDFIFDDLQEPKNYSQLQVHHIDSNSSNNSAFNLVVLPKELHRKFDTTNEKQFWLTIKYYGLTEIILAKQRKLIGVI